MASARNHTLSGASVENEYGVKLDVQCSPELSHSIPSSSLACLPSFFFADLPKHYRHLKRVALLCFHLLIGPMLSENVENSGAITHVQGHMCLHYSSH